MTRQLCFALVAVTALVAAAPSLRADTVAVSFSNTTGQPLAYGPFTLGFQFKVNSPVTVTSLGVFDSGMDGLAHHHDVGIWQSGGALQATATVDAGTTNPLIHQFRYRSIAPLTLFPGTYDIGALWMDGTDASTFPGDATGGFATAPQITFVTDSFITGGRLTDPIYNFANQPAYFGPNFTFTTPSIVPTPKTVWAGLSLFVLMISARGMKRLRRGKC